MCYVNKIDIDNITAVVNHLYLDPAEALNVPVIVLEICITIFGLVLSLWHRSEKATVFCLLLCNIQTQSTYDSLLMCCKES